MKLQLPTGTELGKICNYGGQGFEQQFKIQQAKANDSYCYIKEQLNKELNNLKISAQTSPDVKPIIPILPVLKAIQIPPLQPSGMGASAVLTSDNIYSTIDD